MTFRIRFVLVPLLLTLMFVGCDSSDDTPSQPVIVEPEIDLEKVTHAVIHTNYGNIKVEFYREVAPKTVMNFVTHSKNEYYNEVLFHRVIEDFMMQGGDPTGTGEGGESIYGGEFEDEIDPQFQVVRRGYKRGTMAMANSGPNTNGSQFFIMHKDYPLMRKYTIFGNVVEGINTVDSICTAPTDSTDRPLTNIYMKNITLLIEEES